MELAPDKEEEGEEVRFTEIPAASFYSSSASEKDECCRALLARLLTTGNAPQKEDGKGDEGAASQSGARMLSFARQADALDFLDIAEKQREEQDLPQLHLFSVETARAPRTRPFQKGRCRGQEEPEEGQGREQEEEAEEEEEGESTRHYVVCSYDAMWARHEATAPEERHLYEGIREGAPCHLYFDIEFLYADWPGSDWAQGDRAVTAFEAAVRGAAELTYGRAVACVLDLDASTGTKFSRHVLVKLDGAAFADNAAAGSFVRALLRAHAADAASPAYYTGGAATGGARRCIVDTAVYSRNRLLRMLGSRKWGRTAAFALLPRCRALYGSDRAAFLACLVCNVGVDGVPAACARALRPALLPPVPEDRAAALPHALCPAPEAGPMPLPLPSAQAQARGTEYTPGGTPFPALERFVEQCVCAQGGARGHVRACRVNAAGTVATFTVSGNRYCERVGRQHRHNNVLVVCEVYSGVWHRRCLDPDCRDFRAPQHPIPAEFMTLLPPPPSNE